MSTINGECERDTSRTILSQPDQTCLGGHLKTGHRSTPQNRPPRAWRPRPSVVDRVVVLWSSVLLSFTKMSLGCANVGISRSLRDFQSPVETVLWFPWGCHLHCHLRHRPRSSRLGMLYPCRRADRRSWRLLRGRFGSADPSNRSEAVQLRRCHARHMVLLRRVLGAQVGLDLGAPAFGSALEHMRVME